MKHECIELRKRNEGYEYMIVIESDTSGEWNIARVIDMYSQYKRLIRDIKGCPFCLEELR